MKEIKIVFGIANRYNYIFYSYNFNVYPKTAFFKASP